MFYQKDDSDDSDNDYVNVGACGQSAADNDYESEEIYANCVQ